MDPRFDADTEKLREEMAGIRAEIAGLRRFLQQSG